MTAALIASTALGFVTGVVSYRIARRESVRAQIALLRAEIALLRLMGRRPR